ncbi:MAG: cellulase family glycosylhydrolase [Halapricum sp.]
MIDTNDRWTAEEAWDWYDDQDWLVGCNYVPSTAVNPTGMWQAETFDRETIDRELGWAADLSMNTLRVFLQYVVWEADPEGLKERMDRFLDIADRHGMTTMFVFFDDVAFSGKEPYIGPQDDPIPETHNSQWTPSPGHDIATEPDRWDGPREYVRDIVSTFRDDGRVLMWDVYNEPGNSDMDQQTLPLLRESFDWVRAEDPEQPVTAGVNWDPDREKQNRIGSENADVISFHDYSELSFTKERVERMQERYGRPLLCTEWMARPRDNTVETHLPYFRNEEIGCYTWGLVNGKTQTHLPWSTAQTSIAEAIDEEETDVWFHDLLHGDGTPYRQSEVESLEQIIDDQQEQRQEL